jgi:hypothetical protein
MSEPLMVRPPRPAELRAVQQVEIAAGRLFAEVGMDLVAQHDPFSCSSYGASSTGDRSGWPPVGGEWRTCSSGRSTGAHVEQISVHPTTAAEASAPGSSTPEGLGAARGLPRSPTTFAGAWNRPYYSASASGLADDETHAGPGCDPDLRGLDRPDAPAPGVHAPRGRPPHPPDPFVLVRTGYVRVWPSTYRNRGARVSGWGVGDDSARPSGCFANAPAAVVDGAVVRPRPAAEQILMVDHGRGGSASSFMTKGRTAPRARRSAGPGHHDWAPPTPATSVTAWSASSTAGRAVEVDRRPRGRPRRGRSRGRSGRRPDAPASSGVPDATSASSLTPTSWAAGAGPVALDLARR